MEFRRYSLEIRKFKNKNYDHPNKVHSLYIVLYTCVFLNGKRLLILFLISKSQDILPFAFVLEQQEPQILYQRKPTWKPHYQLLRNAFWSRVQEKCLSKSLNPIFSYCFK